MSSIHIGREADESAPLVVRVHDDGASQQQESAGSTIFWKIGAMYGALAVAMGAYGAHGLKDRVSDPHQQANFALAAQYQLIHSCVLLVAASRGHTLAAMLLMLGMTLFSGSIYALVLDSQRFKVIGPVTPIGGFFLLGGWLALLFTSSQRRYRRINISHM